MTTENNNNSNRNSKSCNLKEIVIEDDLNDVDVTFRNYLQIYLPDFSRIPIDRPNKNKVNVNVASDIQNLYSLRKHHALQAIFYGTQYCLIDSIIIEKYYALLLSKRSKCNIASLPSQLWKEINIYESYNISLTERFTPNEIKKKLKAFVYNPFYDSKSTGIDRISYAHLLNYDKDCLNLTHLFNGCLKLQRVPQCWKRSYSILIKRNKKIKQIKNWRLITLHNTTFQLFQKLLSDRLIIWGKSTGLISKSQKHYYSQNSIYENCFLLQECKKYAEQNGKDLVVAWLDFSNASDSIPQQAIIYLLKRYSIPESIRNIVTDIMCSSTKIRIYCGYTKNIEFLKALPQGFVINNILINFIIEPILQDLANNKNSFQIFDEKINHFVLFHELILIAESPEQLKELINLVGNDAKAIGFHFNHDNCSTLHYVGRNKEIKGTKFALLSKTLRSLKKKDMNEYFGVRRSLSIIQKGIPTIQQMLDSLKTIDKSLLTNRQKIESFQMFLLPRFKSCLQGLQNIDRYLIDQIDNKILRTICSWLNLSPQNRPIKNIINQISELNCRYVNTYFPLIDLLYILKISNAYNVLKSSDKIIYEIAYNSLATEVYSTKSKITPNDEIMNKLSQYLSGNVRRMNRNASTTWQMAREAILKLQKNINMVWLFKNNEIQLVIKDNNSKLRLTNNSPFYVQEALEKIIINNYLKK